MSETPKKKVFDFSLLGRVFRFVKPYRWLFYLSIVLAILMAIFAPVRPYLIQLTVDKATGKAVLAPQWLKALLFGTDLSDATRFIIAVTLFQVVFLFVETTIRFVFSFITAWMGQSVVKDMRITVYRKILGLNLRQFDRTPIGTLTTRTINDIESINDIFSDGLIPIIADLLTIVITLGTMFWMDWRLTLICLVPFPVMIVATYYFKESVNKSFIRVRNAVASLNAFVQEHITGMQVVQAFSAEEREFTKFKKINSEHRNANIKAIFAYSVFFPVVEVVLALSMGFLVWWIADRSLDAGLLIAFILYLNQIFRPLRVIADKFNVLQMGMIAAERVLKVLDNTDEIVPVAEGAYQPAHIRGEIRFEKVWFAYIDEQYVLKDIDFEVKAGQTVALVGHTGSGKTSIISLLNRLYHIQKGSIKIDGVNVEDYELDCLRKGIGVVLQDVFLFSGSVMDNITLRNPDISGSQVMEAAKMIGVHDFIMQLPGGYDYNVMERGSTLSLGQRQLLSFIRALLYNPSILILDEATSSVDTESEQLIERAIDTLISGRTSIVIAHRLSTIRKADKIIVLDKGEIRETGNHEELLLLGGFYAKLHEMQFEKQKQKVAVAG
ncbi:ATP-binding cassette, subfamily B [Hydrobacter penzbergensis]|jgi:ATP-binding cassette subfamily B multidrug efflux pump|uniref:ATP-binding cassette, subfamily B n=1 Tax=Hydrobacter penzbergensis TaxID=1235997 RepID=A0A8X8IF10_9BACT|nr:ABC transporter ATP-binding protein [Hydrobacter penzbergensis]MBN8719057.1 ABC transporter ATP-binding protein [Sediminibacterium magnilacihabitans]PQV60936.1 ATP-binding cassette subfamily B protein [Sediminibacterium magnilacihabitans]SDW94111.1 ATP-binding cassette, subfamily B [Hydrobacter penzbergensis]